MDWLFRKRRPQLEEVRAAGEFVIGTMSNVRDTWATVSEIMGLGDVEAQQVPYVQFEVALARSVIGLQALPNLFEPTQAGRLRDWVMNMLLADDPLHDEIIRAIQEYETGWKNALDLHELPPSGVAAVLYRRLRLRDTVVVHGESYISPIRLSRIMIVLSENLGFWKEVATKFDLVP